MTKFDANMPWFTFTAQSDATGTLEVYSFSGVEGVSKPYEFRVELVDRTPSRDISSLLGTPALLSVADRSGGIRLVHGIISDVFQLHTANRYTHYAATIVPRLWFLDKIQDHRIFQNLSIVEIIRQILLEQGFDADAVSFKLFYEYEPREYCVQYKETDLHFITRLCEEEGVYFYFEHSENAHTLCFCDREGGPKIPGEHSLRYHMGSGHPADTSVISRLSLKHSVDSNSASYNEWNFDKPQLNLLVSKKEPDRGLAPVPKGMLLEQYRYPHIYELRAQGERYAGLQLERQLTFSRVMECQADVARFIPSYTFAVREHPRDDVNTNWFVVAVRHEGRQPGVLKHEAPSERGEHYRSFVTAIPEMTRFIPALEHPKRRIEGEQTAIVTGPAGEEIYPDKYGRVKVQFFWDREGEWNEKTTCWVRVSQAWAGTLYGTMAIPRMGHEVIVSFLEGDPDRPIITGRVYHALNKVPYELPGAKNRSVFKSMSTLGGEGDPRGFNEFRIDDTAGEEEIYGHAEKDVNIHIKNDWAARVKHDLHRKVDKLSALVTEGETHTKLQDQRKTKLEANENLTVHGDSHGEIEKNWLGDAGTEFHLESGIKIVMEAGSELTLKAGGSWLKLDSSGIHGGPKVFPNSGNSPSPGTPANPLLPGEAIVPAVPLSPICPDCMESAAMSRRAFSMFEE